ncbi:phosphotransferase family protein [Streptomyces endophyticus]|uniref:Aminoglycoside phosphotransferase n=1 Tax=Streptomyces endophyticus TaxID=714166 RepID=A0ABU6F202_9ACTN|nr:aminoglycoside phosphotransferase [Streptomyces endophyticus]MEB8338034.1 aminoglycoside phosphotransferase [Streptomyces endophyticus]
MSVADGLNSEIAVTLDTCVGRVFVKGLRSDHPRVWTQQREAAINPYVAPIAPRLLWTISDEQWNLLGYEYIEGRRATYDPRSGDLPLVAEALTTLWGVQAPAGVDLKEIGQRLAAYLDGPDDAELLNGDALLHTDWHPDNVLIVEGAARVVDWAWPTRGASWIDTAYWVIWLVAAGHDPVDAELWAAKVPAWSTATGDALKVFAKAQARLWAEIAEDAPDIAWMCDLADAAGRWAAYRQNG